MTESQIKAVVLKLEDLINVINVLYKESKDLEEVEKHTNRQKEIVLRKEGGLIKREALLKSDKSALDVKVRRLMEKSKAIAKREHELVEKERRFENQINLLTEKKLEIETKRLELDDLEDRGRLINERGLELDKQRQELIERESLVEKEKKIAKERNQHLELKEKTLNNKAEKLQRMLDSVQ